MAVEPRIRELTALFLRRLREDYYDFIDLGTCNGGGFEIAALQGGRRGLGFDLDPHAVKRSLDKGLDVALYDLCTLRGDRACVDFAVCSHVLEHLPDMRAVGDVIDAAATLCRDYLLISGPCFEEEDYLYAKGIRLLHSLMPDHTCKLKVIDLIDVLHGLRLRDYVIALTEPIRDSRNPWAHAIDQPVPPDGLWTYDAGKHLPKPDVVFDRAIHRDFVCVLPLREGIDTAAILRDFRWGHDRIVQRASWRFEAR